MIYRFWEEWLELAVSIERSQSTALTRILLQALLQLYCIFPFLLCLDLKTKAMWWEIWRMMNSYEDVPYIYQKNLLSEESKMMSMRSFGKLRPDSCTILEIRGVPLKQPLPVVKEKTWGEAPTLLAMKLLLVGTYWTTQPLVMNFFISEPSISPPCFVLHWLRSCHGWLLASLVTAVS